jgi:roadblock/LC7 domain-containing protein
MIRRLLTLEGVETVCQFRDDGRLVEAHGALDEPHLGRLAKFAHDYARLVQSNADQLSMFTQMSRWTPPRGWIVRGARMSVCSVGNLVCLVRNEQARFDEVMRELHDAAHW